MFRTDGFVPRGHCGAGWDYWLLIVANSADVLIFVAYFGLLPWALMLLLRRHGWLTKERAIAYLVFIAFCGVGHLFKAVATIWPAYYFFVTWDCLTVLTSFYAAGVTFGEANK